MDPYITFFIMDPYNRSFTMDFYIRILNYGS